MVIGTRVLQVLSNNLVGVVVTFASFLIIGIPIKIGNLRRNIHYEKLAWQPRHICIVYASWIALGFLGSTVVLLLLGGKPFDKHNLLLQIFQGASGIFLLLSIFILFLRTKNHSLGVYGWKTKDIAAHEYLSLALFSIIIFIRITLQSRETIPSSSEIELISDLTSPLPLTLNLFFVCILTPFVEEIFFRHMIYPILREVTGVLGGIILTSISFGILHSLSSFVPSIILSVLFCYLYQRSNSIIPSFTLHSLHNMSIALFYFNDRRLFHFLTSHYQWFALACLIAIVILLILYMKKRPR